jgi:hypothetical protein
MANPPRSVHGASIFDVAPTARSGHRHRPALAVLDPEYRRAGVSARVVRAGARCGGDRMGLWRNGAAETHFGFIQKASRTLSRMAFALASRQGFFAKLPSRTAPDRTWAAPVAGAATAWDGQDRHDLHRFARKDCEVRMVFEKLCGRLG